MPKITDTLTLRLLSDGDIPLIKTWLDKPHVKKWYDIPPLCSIQDWLAEIEGRYDEFSFIRHLIAMLGETPIGFGQYYDCCDAEEEWYGDVPLAGAYSIDYFIGEEAYLGQGLGKGIVGLLATRIFALPGALRIIVQPDSANGPSCGALLGNGFVFTRGLYLLNR